MSKKFNPYLEKDFKESQNKIEKLEKDIKNLNLDIDMLNELKAMLIEDFDINESSLKKIIESYKKLR